MVDIENFGDISSIVQTRYNVKHFNLLKTKELSSFPHLSHSETSGVYPSPSLLLSIAGALVQAGRILRTSDIRHKPSVPFHGLTASGNSDRASRFRSETCLLSS